MKQIKPEGITPEDKIQVDIAIMIAEARIAKNLTQHQLADLMGTKQPAIARAENGGYNTTVGFLIRVAKATGLEMGLSWIGLEKYGKRNLEKESLISQTRLQTLEEVSEILDDNVEETKFADEDDNQVAQIAVKNFVVAVKQSINKLKEEL